MTAPIPPNKAEASPTTMVYYIDIVEEKANCMDTVIRLPLCFGLLTEVQGSYKTKARAILKLPGPINGFVHNGFTKNVATATNRDYAINTAV